MNKASHGKPSVISVSGAEINWKKGDEMTVNNIPYFGQINDQLAIEDFDSSACKLNCIQ